QGKETGSVTLPENIFGLAWNADLMHQVVTSMQSNARAGTAHTKGRGEVRGGGKKPWQQKGTGRARHGSSRSPIWRGGGVTHGPKSEKNYARTITRSMRQKALLVALSKKAKDGEILFIDTLSFASPKAKDAKAMLSALKMTRRKNAALIAIPTIDAATKKSFRNFGNVAVEELRNLNPVSVLSKRQLIIANPDAALKALAKNHE
ncbi:MAG: 50S ribosomal protein L4, partial [Patescibacteria group bacterium]